MFAEAVEIDARIRHQLALYKTHRVHRLRMSLDQEVARDEAAQGVDRQRDEFADESEGHYGVRG